MAIAESGTSGKERRAVVAVLVPDGKEDAMIFFTSLKDAALVGAAPDVAPGTDASIPPRGLSGKNIPLLFSVINAFPDCMGEKGVPSAGIPPWPV